jgi:hypothetical protein
MAHGGMIGIRNADRSLLLHEERSEEAERQSLLDLSVERERRSLFQALETRQREQSSSFALKKALNLPPKPIEALWLGCYGQVLSKPARALRRNLLR